MKNFIRFPGLIVFAIIVGVIYLSVEPLIKWSIESASQVVFRAKVDIADVDVDFTNAKLTISGMRVGDKDKPMQNLFEFTTATADIELMKMFMGQYVINDLSLKGLQLGTARKTSAALKKYSKKAGDKKTSGFEMPAWAKTAAKKTADALPDADTALARLNLKTDALYKELDNYIGQQEKAWDALQKRLPDNNTVDDYKKQMKSITDGKIKSVADFKQRKKRLDDLQDQIKADKKALKDARNRLQDNKAQISQKLKALKKAPEQDMDKLRSQYQLNEGGAVNVSGLLFGSQAQEYLTTGLSWYHKAQPYLETSPEEKAEKEKRKRSEGVFVHFSNKQPPEFWLKNAQLQMLMPLGEFQVTLKNVSHQQKRTGKPVTAHLQSTAVKKAESITANLVVDHRSKEQFETIDFNVQQYQVRDKRISKSDKLSVSLAHSQLNAQGDIKRQGGKVASDVRLKFSEVNFAGEADNKFGEELLLALETVQKFNMAITGKNGLKGLDLDSDLDNQLKAAFKARINAKKEEFEAKVREKLDARLDEQLAKLDIPTEEWAEADSSLEDKINSLDELLEAKLDDYKDEQKEKAKDKLKNKLKDLF